MRVRIHRGTKEIGGSCIELEAQSGRILLDLGLPLDGDPEDTSLHPKVDGLQGGENLLALVLSHGHLDHWGLAHLAGPALPTALGAATHRILKAAQPFLPKPYVPHQAVEFCSGTPLTFGPITVTPHLVDHSAYDAYAMEVEAEGKRLFYSGDFRGHGRKGTLFERLVANRQFPTEREIEGKLLDIFLRTEGMALVAASAQNIDRMVSRRATLWQSGKNRAFFQKGAIFEQLK